MMTFKRWFVETFPNTPFPINLSEEFLPVVVEDFGIPSDVVCCKCRRGVPTYTTIVDTDCSLVHCGECGIERAIKYDEELEVAENDLYSSDIVTFEKVEIFLNQDASIC